MRGYIEGALWGLILGGITASGASYHAATTVKPPAETAAAAVAPAASAMPAPPTPAAAEVASEPPRVTTEVAGSITAFAKASFPRMPQEQRAPLVDRWIPVLTNRARQPGLPLIDAAPAPQAAPEVAIVAPDPAPAPAVETVSLQQRPAPAPAPAPLAVQVQEDQPSAMPVPPAPSIITTPEAGEDAPAPRTEDPGTGVVINRLGVQPSAPVGEPAEIIAPDIPDPDAPDLDRYSAAFENPDDLPMLAIVLIEGGTIADPAAAIAGLGFAPTVVVNALAPDAADQLQAYRAAGAEVAMELALPVGALPSDVEVAFEAALGLLPEAAMLYSSGGDVVQGDRQVTAQVIEVLSARGMGFVAQEQGFGGAVRSADQAGVPAVAVARDLDGNGETAAAIVRALDQAAFRARQSGDVVLRARLDDATLAALRDWAAANTGSGTIMGPVSGILRSGD